MPSLLIVDDEPNLRSALKKRLQSSELRVLTADLAGECIDLVKTERPDVMILDVRLPDMSGLDAFDHIREIDPRLPVIIVTAYSTTETAIDAMKRGAFEYLLKPIDIHQLREVVAKAVALSRMRRQPAVSERADDDAAADPLVGHSPPMQEVYKAIGRIAPEDVNVLITGESGTGKELVARAVYHHSQRSGKPFSAINCAALPEGLLESELFGHERGSFTGAERQRIGKFEQAHGGTLFLDELGDMSLGTQAKVLRLLQDGRFERVGGNETIQTDVRVVAATNQNLDAKIAAGEFRQDLLYRLNGFTIRLPPLRERLDDLPLLIEHFLRLANRETTKRATTVSPETLQILEAYDWPGNVRELQSVIRYAVVHAVSEVITPECLPETCRTPLVQSDLLRAFTPDERSALARFVRRMLHAGQAEIYRHVQSAMDRVALEEVLRHVRGNQVHASERLGMSRTTLRAKIKNLQPAAKQ
jgi:nitrogen regulation protein NR(I)